MFPLWPQPRLHVVAFGGGGGGGGGRGGGGGAMIGGGADDGGGLPWEIVISGDTPHVPPDLLDDDDLGDDEADSEHDREGPYDEHFTVHESGPRARRTSRSPRTAVPTKTADVRPAVMPPRGKPKPVTSPPPKPSRPRGGRRGG